MLRIGSCSLADYPGAVAPIECPRCGRAGRYAHAGRTERFGQDIALPDLLLDPACERRKDFSAPCGARFTDLAERL
jgi:hypothetical protein